MDLRANQPKPLRSRAFELFYNYLSDSCPKLFSHQNTQLPDPRRPRVSLCLGKVMTILIHFHQSNYCNFKAYHLKTSYHKFALGLIDFDLFSKNCYLTAYVLS